MKSDSSTNRAVTRKTLICLIILLILAVVFDQYTKMLAVTHLADSSDLILIPGVLQLHYLENTGAAFSFLEGHPGVFLALTPVMCAAILWVLIRLPRNRGYWMLRIPLVMLIAGAIGNFIDRAVNHYVVDFIYFSLINFPVFNVADIYVTVSIAVTIAAILFVYKEPEMNELDHVFSRHNEDDSRGNA